MTETRNEKGEWVPAIPLPLFGFLGSLVCHCGRRFFRYRRYSEHFTYEHHHMGR